MEVQVWGGPSACVCAKSLQSYPTLCDPKDCSPPGSSVCRILQARILMLVAMPLFRGSLLPWEGVEPESSGAPALKVGFFFSFYH